MINEELAWIQKRMDPKGLTVFWRSYSENVHSAPLKWLNPSQVAPRCNPGQPSMPFPKCNLALLLMASEH